MKKYGTEKNHESENRRSHSYVARHEARDQRGRFTSSGRDAKAEKRADKKNDDCACTQSLGTDYAEQKYHHEHGHPWNNEKRSEDRRAAGNYGQQEPVEVISITSYTLTESYEPSERNNAQGNFCSSEADRNINFENGSFKK